MQVVYNHRDPLIRFGVEQIKKVLETQRIEYVERFDPFGMGMLPTSGIVVKSSLGAREKQPVDSGSFSIRRAGSVIQITGNDSRGAFYGCLEWAERMARGAELADGDEISQAPAMRLRGVKYNLPYAAFDSGDPFVQNEATCLDLNFWKSYIDMLALNRYNCLSLWSEHPFHLMVVSDKYRAANPFSDVEIDRNIHLFRELIRHAKERGIDVYLFTWNIRLLPEVARGLGLPEVVGDFGDMYANLIHRVGLPLNQFRAKSDLIRDYIREMVLQVLITYPDLAGLGTSASEWMDGTGHEREEWIVQTYIQAIRESGRKIPFIHRTNMQNAGNEIKDLVQPQFDPDDFYISWKYSNAHCYSYPEPQFEKLWHAWDGIDLDTTQVLYTVRNDDVFTHRWGDPEYVKKYVKGMLKPYVKGFYWGADGYVWGRDFQHVDYGHKTWTYDYERHLFQFQLWGRLSYNPDLENDVWIHLMQKQYGPSLGAQYLEGFRHASKIIPAVNRLFWIDYDFQWHPESCLSQVSGFKTIDDFVDGNSMPGVGVMSLRAYAEAEHAGTLETEKGRFCETPEDIIQELRNASDNLVCIVEELEQNIGEHRASHAECTLLDLQAYIAMGRYYVCKFNAALELNRYRCSRDERHKRAAEAELQQACGHWERLGHLWSLHNKPYFMARVKMTFGYPYYLQDVERDVERAKQFN